jgi:S-adenosylmethionine:tRNA ribosyltransferase-isomerase
MVYVNVAAQVFSDHLFPELPDLLPPATLLVVNDSRVIPARIEGQRISGARVELLYHRYLGDGVIEAVIGSNARLAVGEVLRLPGGWRAELLTEKSRDGSRVRLADDAGGAPVQAAVLTWLEQHGSVPLPPYIKRPVGMRVSASADAPTRVPTSDAERYQTVYAAAAGSVAAPTAGLHFTAAILDELRARGHTLRQVTLHVGLGTFAPVRVDDLAGHAMHSEEFTVPEGLPAELAAQRAAGAGVLAVGTTSLRVLHAVGTRVGASADALTRIPTETRAFIYPGHGTHAADLLLTNFHLPGSTLLALVYAFGGESLMHQVYAHAIANRYRFFSYGDCMLIDRRGAALTEDGTADERSHANE